MNPSPEVVSKLKDAVSRGIDGDESSRRRWSLIGSAAGSVAGLAALVLFVRFVLEDRSWSWRVPGAVLAVSLAIAALQYRRLAPRLPQEHREEDLSPSPRSSCWPGSG
ncbi:MAG TPA: hypothetical protein VFQ51_03775 [Vicinamibacteria bacterium]|nr:hypothetical protein [Vicinamibacteria bacterium]